MTTRKRSTLLFIHGLGGNENYFLPQIKGLVSDFNIVSYELPGHGRQSHLPKEHCSFRFASEEIVQKVRRGALEGAILVGHSIGGLVALEAIASHPFDFSGALLIDSTFLVPEDQRVGLKGFDDLHRSPDYRELLASFARDLLTNDSTEPELRKLLIQDFSSLSPVLWQAYWQEMTNFDAEDKLRKIEKCLMYLHSIAPTDTDLLKSIVPKATIVEFPRSGHFIQLEFPDEVNCLIREFAKQANFNS